MYSALKPLTRLSNKLNFVIYVLGHVGRSGSAGRALDWRLKSC